ncbi:hypothetical protein N8Z89_00490, partial [bacterium]|nr:hypothetical protein [bacterium]
EDDFRPEERFLTERFITASLEFTYQEELEVIDYNSNNRNKNRHDFPIHHTNRCRPYSSVYVDDKDNKSVAGTNDISLDMVSLDIECSMQGELYSVGLYSKGIKGQAVQCILMIGDQFKAKSNTSLSTEEQIIERCTTCSLVRKDHQQKTRLHDQCFSY